ncbi:MAG TPA: hypothetical protein VHZ50_01160, partial [Puia sp.]|nr:hypothetical protein [Puia sp.]
MKISFIKYAVLLFVVCGTSCVKKIQPPIRDGEPILVVEGSVTTDSAPYQVKLSYTGNFRYANIDSNQHFINDATVIIKNDDG